MFSVTLVPMAALAEEEAKAITSGSKVGIEYTLKLADGTTADSNVGGEPLVYTSGDEMILPALEAALMGLEKGDSKELTLAPEDAYGPVRPELEREIPTEKIPEDGRHEGAVLMSEGPNGQAALVRVKEVKEDVILLDLNHPLAGQALHFDVKVLSVE
jgi:FKBP-type peptidyl-prolyl cis-trans isomerase 2